MQRHWLLLSLLVAPVSFAQYPGAKKAPPEWKQGFDSINLSDAQFLLSSLAGPDFRGRNPQSPDYAAAAGFCVAWFRQYGIGPGAADGTYFQRVEIQKITMSNESTFGSGDTTLAWNSEVQYSTQDPKPVEANFAFVRFAKDTKLSDLDLPALKGRVIINHPTNSPLARATYAQFQAWASDPANGAAGFYVATTLSLPDIPVTNSGPAGIPLPNGAPFTGLRLKLEAAARLATSLGAQSFPRIEEPPKSTIELATRPVQINPKSSREILYTTLNVLAKLEGSDPLLKSETVLFGSHLDHLGVNARGTFFGADDNASGVTANLLIARAIAQNRVRPKRSILFALWTSEESGLFGSRYYAANPAVPLDKTIAAINMDMLGRDAEMPAFGERPGNNTNSVYAGIAKLNSPDLYRLVHEANRYVALNLRDDKEDRTRRSDTAPFVAAGIPTLKAFTGEHKDYHQPTDTIEKINFPKFVAITRWLYLSAQSLASQAARPAFVEGARYLRGKVTYLPKVTLPASAIVQLRLLDGSVELDRTTITNPGQVPVFFSLVYRPKDIKAGNSYTVEATIKDGKVLLFQATGVAVLQQDQATDGLEIVLTQALTGR
jgi:uncharacterized lipoprotein YbaY